MKQQCFLSLFHMQPVQHFQNRAFCQQGKYLHFRRQQTSLISEQLFQKENNGQGWDLFEINHVGKSRLRKCSIVEFLATKYFKAEN